MPIEDSSLRTRAKKELILLLVMLLTGLFFLPVVIYFIGKTVFGAYDGGGFTTFYGMLHSEFRAGEPVVWFLMLCPYLVWSLFRLTSWGIRQTSRAEKPAAQ